MITVPIPPWNSSGVVPPIYPGYPGNSPFRAPFQVSLLDFIQRFSNTQRRQKILKGLLEYRNNLHHAGLSKGFQWINGSFVENVEANKNRNPNDIDVVTFFELPPGETEVTLNTKSPHLFDNKQIKQQFLTDSYCFPLGNDKPISYFIKLSHYWYSMWAHQRDSFAWKGFLEIDLSREYDDESMKYLLNQTWTGVDHE